MPEALTVINHAERPTVELRDVYFRMLEPTEIKAAMDFPQVGEVLTPGVQLRPSALATVLMWLVKA